MPSGRRLLVAASTLALVITGTVLVRPGTGRALSGPAELVSIDPTTGAAFLGNDYLSTLSGDGTIDVFTSQPFSDANRQPWVRDRTAGVTTPVPFQADTHAATVSRDGCVIAFWGSSVDVETFVYRLQVWNRCTGAAVVELSTAVETVTAPNEQSVALSADGRFLAWATPTGEVGVTDTTAGGVAGSTTVIAGSSTAIARISSVERVDISDDGNTVVYSAFVGDSSQVFAWDRATTSVQVVSVDAAGQNLEGQSPSVSADGRFVAYVSCVDSKSPRVLTVRDRVEGTTNFIPAPGGDATGNAYAPDINPDGTQIAVVYNGASVCFLSAGRGREVVSVVRSTSGVFQTVKAETISYTLKGVATFGSDPSISATGRFVSFDSADSAGLIGQGGESGLDVWVRERIPQLSAPPRVDFGRIGVGVHAPPQPIDVTNASDVIVPIVSVVPPDSGFRVVGDKCTGVLLQPGAACRLLVDFTPDRLGLVTSTVTVNGDGTSVQTGLRGRGIPLPRLIMNPGVVASGEVAFAVGKGFPPNRNIQLVIENVGPLMTVRADKNGQFRKGVVILVNSTLRVGGHQVLAVDQPEFSGVRAPLLLKLASFQPAAAINPALLPLSPSMISMLGRG